LRDHEVLVETLSSHADELEQRIATLESELATRGHRVQQQRDGLVADAEARRAELDAGLTQYAEALTAKRATLDAAFEAYRDGDASTRVQRLNAELDALTARRDKLAVQVAEQEERFAAAKAQIEALRSLVKG